jgi:hypothetical protein
MLVMCCKHQPSNNLKCNYALCTCFICSYALKTWKLQLKKFKKIELTDQNQLQPQRLEPKTTET